jgi:hypothetical protein
MQTISKHNVTEVRALVAAPSLLAELLTAPNACGLRTLSGCNMPLEKTTMFGMSTLVCETK